MFGENYFCSFFGFEIAGIGGRDLREPHFGMRFDQIRRFDSHEAAPPEV
jgi:hypothetical protein